ncbi:hypothetical protein AB205_0205770, partial [Aquarana catesbeiana]
MHTGAENERPIRSSSELVMLHTVKKYSVPTALEAMNFGKSNKKYPTYDLIQKIWSKTKYMQGVTGFTDYSPIWFNDTYPELAKMQNGAIWRRYGVLYIRQIFQHGKLHTFETLQRLFELPQSMRFYYMQLKHAVVAQSKSTDWVSSPTPMFNVIAGANNTKGFISQCYSMLLQNVLNKHPLGMLAKWERDVGPMDGDQLYAMGLRPTPLCTRCKREHGDLIHLLWRCPKLHPYWKGVVDTVNRVFQVKLPTDPKHCLLNVLDELGWEEYTKVAVTKAIFLARKLIMKHWISEEPPALKEWINAVGEMLRKDK